MSVKPPRPLVSCLMPARGSRRSIALAVEYFERQDYPHRELILIEDGVERLEHLALPERYRRVRVSPGAPPGFCWNAACEAARGAIVLHWDPEDWQAADRISHAVRSLGRRHDIYGHRVLLRYDVRTGVAQSLSFEGQQLAANSLGYRRAFWKERRFSNDEPDACGLFAKQATRVTVGDGRPRLVRIEDGNGRGAGAGPGAGDALPPDRIRSLLGEDWWFYEQQIREPEVPPPSLKMAALETVPTGGPLVSCLMVARGTARPVGQAIEYFRRQGYEARELLILDVSPAGIASAVPAGEMFRYVRLTPGTAAAECLDVARKHASGEILMHWEENDWHAPHRIRAQIEMLTGRQAAVCSVSPFRFYDSRTGQAWRFQAAKADDAPVNSLCYRRDCPDPLAAHGVSLTDSTCVLSIIDATNAERVPHAGSWIPEAALDIRNLLQDDWFLYEPRIKEAVRGGTPLVSCIMPTCSRRRFARLAIACFQKQDYESRELWIVDDGSDPIADLVPEDSRIHYLRVEEKLPESEKLYLGREQAAGDLILHWADDDWHAPDRIRCQVRALLDSGAGMCGLNRAMFFDLRTEEAWLCHFPPAARLQVYSGSLCYWKTTWGSRHSRHEDAFTPELAFVDSRCVVAFIDERNAVDKPSPGVHREQFPSEELYSVVGSEWPIVVRDVKAPVVLSDFPRPSYAAIPETVRAPGRDRMYDRPALTLSAYRNLHAGETMLVCGCGASLSTLLDPERFITIGVNDVGRLFQPNYLVVVNPRNQFTGDRFRFVETSRARAIFTQLDLGIRHPRIVRFQLGERAGTDFSNPNVLHYTSNSPYVALSLAIHMGARRIGMIGVDFTEDHFFSRTGRHPLDSQMPQIDQEYTRLYHACRNLGTEIFNLSASSRLTAFPRLSLDEFAAIAGKEEPRRRNQALSVVSYATTPVVGVPLILSRAITSRTHHACRTVWATRAYANGVAFDGDLEWDRAPSEAESLLRSASLIIAHNGKTNPRHLPLFDRKPVITMAHNYFSNVDPTFVNRGFPGVVVGQYQATLPEFQEWHVVPNPVPLWEPAFQPGPKPARVAICYTPSARHHVYPSSHSLYWHSKGFETTMSVLQQLERSHGIQLEVLRDGQVPHAESLAMKRRSHIVIDECVTGSYHRNSLEGLALGCVVVNGVGRLPAVQDVFRRCSGASEIPFVYAGLEDLESVLRELIEQGPDALAAAGARNRLWMEEHWDFDRQWKRFWVPAVSQALDRADQDGSRIGALTFPEHSAYRDTVLEELNAGLSAVVPYGGKDRLPQFSAALAILRQCEGVDEIVVADMGSAPSAEAVAGRWADKYVFIQNDDAFEKARTINTGSALTAYDLVLWLDNDLVVPPGFMASAIAEIRERQLDFLIPYTAIHYLSDVDTRQVVQGVRNPADCAPVNVFRADRDCTGGAGIVRRSFLLAFGGMSEEFRGWGGEDDAWWHKAQVLGRAGVSHRHDQLLYHLYHENSGSNRDNPPRANNPYYAQNVSVLGSMRRLRTRNDFLEHFPPQTTLSQVWAGRRISFISESPVNGVCGHLSQLFGIKIEHRSGANFDSSWLGSALSDPPESIVIDGLRPALQLLSDDRASRLWRKTVVVLPKETPRPASGEILGRAAAIVTKGTEPPGDLGATLALLQPLSIVLGGAVPCNAKGVANDPTPERVDRGNPDCAGPVWLFWEGECPEWIKQCQRTIYSHAPDVRLLSTHDFDKLRDSDRDIDLTRLHVAHRADYIRAFLLHRYGGVWIDSDCIVMQSLEPTLARLKQYDFLAHRERSGYASNGFIGSRAGGVIISALYRRICDTLRSGLPLGWVSLGSGPLTEILNSATVDWYEMECEQIQPVCWSNPQAFFAVGNSARHESVFDARATCYMLSNTEIRRFQANDPSAKLLAEETFFRFLIRKSLQSTASGPDRQKDGSVPLSICDPKRLGQDASMEHIFARHIESYVSVGHESLSGPGSSMYQTAEIRQRLPLLFQDLGILSLLDAPSGDFNWMQHVVLALEKYTGVDIVSALIERNQKKYGGPKRKFLRLDLTRAPLPKADLIQCRDFLPHLANRDVFRVLRNFVRSGSTYLLTTTFGNLIENTDIATGGWRPLNLQRAPLHFPPPLRVINEKCNEEGGRYADKSLALWEIEALKPHLL